MSGLSVNLSVFLYASLLSSPFFNCSSVSISHLTVFFPLFYCLHLLLSLFNLLCLTGRRNSRCLVVVLKIVFCMTDASPHLASPRLSPFSFAVFLQLFSVAGFFTPGSTTAIMLLLHPTLSCFWEQELCENGSGRNTETACVSESNPLLSTCAKALR